MARYDFGGTLADFVVTSHRLGTLDTLALSAATLTMWSAQSGGTRYTDLVLNGSAVSSIVVGSDGQVPKFQGPDGVTEMWADGGSGRVRVVTLQGAPGPAGPTGPVGPIGPGGTGPAGPQGPAGAGIGDIAVDADGVPYFDMALSGTGPSNTAVAGYVTATGPTKDALSTTFAPQRAVAPSKPAVHPGGKFEPVVKTFPTVTISAGNAATAISGTVTDISAGEVPGSWASPVWDSTTTFTTGQGVCYPTFNDYVYLALANSTGVTPGTDSTKWRLLRGDARIAFLGSPVSAYRTVPSGTGSFLSGIINDFRNPNTQRSVTPVVGWYGKDIEFKLPGQGGQVRAIVDGVTDVTGERTVTDAAVTNASTTLTSATANFTSDDVGRIVTGPGQISATSTIKQGTYIASVTNATTVVLSQTAGATASGLSLRVHGGWKFIPSGGQIIRVRLSFTDADHHVIALECASQSFLGITISAGDVLHKPALKAMPRVITEADSIGQGQNTDGTRLDLWPQFLGKIMGWDVWDDSIGGSGFINPGPPVVGSTNFENRLRGRDAAWNPDVVVVAGGLNDQITTDATYTQSAVTAATASYVNAFQSLLPTKTLVIVGPFFTTDLAADAANYNNTKTVRDGQVAALSGLPGYTYDSTNYFARAGNIIYVDTLPTWLTGKYGNAGGSGSATVLLSADGIHPRESGHRYYARRIAAVLDVALSKSGLL